MGRQIELAHKKHNEDELIELYGKQKAEWLTKKHKGWMHQQELNQKINGLDGTKYPGSATKQGWLYHDYALPDQFRNIHRRNTAARLLHIKPHIDFPDKRVLDLGCAAGGMTIGLALLNASVVYGIDYDLEMLHLGNTIAQKYMVKNAEFHHQKIPALNDLKPNFFPHCDVIIWLSQWMWVVKEHGLEDAKKLLCVIPQFTGATNMVFESAARDGKAPIPDTTQEDLETYLREWSPFSNIRKIGAFPDGWSGEQRQVFVCDTPVYQWGRFGNFLDKAVVTRPKVDRIRKTYSDDRMWAMKNEVECYERLEGHPNFPQILKKGKKWIELSWCGSPYKVVDHLIQLNTICNALREAHIVHRDLNPPNLLCLEGKLKLIDFEYAELDRKPHPMGTPKGLGRGFYPEGFNDTHAARLTEIYMKGLY